MIFYFLNGSILFYLIFNCTILNVCKFLGCIPLLIQLLHGIDKDVSPLGDSRGSRSTRARAAEALHNIVHSNPEMRSARLEKHVLHLLEQIRAYCDQLNSSSDEEGETQENPSSYY